MDNSANCEKSSRYELVYKMCVLNTSCQRTSNQISQCQHEINKLERTSSDADSRHQIESLKKVMEAYEEFLLRNFHEVKQLQNNLAQRPPVYYDLDPSFPVSTTSPGPSIQRLLISY